MSYGPVRVALNEGLHIFCKTVFRKSSTFICRRKGCSYRGGSDDEKQYAEVHAKRASLMGVLVVLRQLPAKFVIVLR